jgi:aryl-alcohol dehydrogenase-like predicted oxidoreductase
VTSKKDKDDMYWDRITIFLIAYEHEIRYLCSKRVEQYVSGLKIGYEKGKIPLQQFALKYLIDNPDVTCVLNGITEQSYLDDVFPLLGIK